MASTTGLVVLVPWQQYHDLNANATASRFDSVEAAKARSENDFDRIIVAQSDEEAAQIAQTFENLCYAAWSPNQSDAEKDTNAPIIRAAMEFFASYS